MQIAYPAIGIFYQFRSDFKVLPARPELEVVLLGALYAGGSLNKAVRSPLLSSALKCVVGGGVLNPGFPRGLHERFSVGRDCGRVRRDQGSRSCKGSAGGMRKGSGVGGVAMQNRSTSTDSWRLSGWVRRYRSAQIRIGGRDRGRQQESPDEISRETAVSALAQGHCYQREALYYGAGSGFACRPEGCLLNSTTPPQEVGQSPKVKLSALSNSHGPHRQHGRSARANCSGHFRTNCRSAFT